MLEPDCWTDVVATGENSRIPILELVASGAGRMSPLSVATTVVADARVACTGTADCSLVTEDAVAASSPDPD
jgi:hypothetical protein